MCVTKTNFVFLRQVCRALILQFYLKLKESQKVPSFILCTKSRSNVGEAALILPCDSQVGNMASTAFTYA